MIAARPCPGWKRPCGVSTFRPYCQFCERSKSLPPEPTRSLVPVTDRIENAILALPVIGANAGWDHLRRRDVLAIIEREKR
jgi:hypothetical protein